MPTYLRETIKEVMVAYNKAHEAWVLEYGNDNDFNAWFTKQVMGR